ncbi:hypothetical protein E2C01_073043 [Portunus trituberculatus]|uniref:Uncharacterized protein n=1 Tax=Portunus trituberculatus TaxID=210409 RepID=A0A5B7I8U5_PORTR|nr:hypothetical protein [Portunus trituberculatus]
MTRRHRLIREAWTDLAWDQTVKVQMLDCVRTLEGEGGGRRDPSPDGAVREPLLRRDDQEILEGFVSVGGPRRGATRMGLPRCHQGWDFSTA